MKTDRAEASFFMTALMLLALPVGAAAADTTISVVGTTLDPGAPKFCTNNPSVQCSDNSPCAPKWCLGGLNNGRNCTADSECGTGTCKGQGTCLPQACVGVKTSNAISLGATDIFLLFDTTKLAPFSIASQALSGLLVNPFAEPGKMRSGSASLLGDNLPADGTMLTACFGVIMTSGCSTISIEDGDGEPPDDFPGPIGSPAVLWDKLSGDICVGGGGSTTTSTTTTTTSTTTTTTLAPTPTPSPSPTTTSTTTTSTTTTTTTSTTTTTAQPSPTPTPAAEDCFDIIDNDGDGLIDSRDPDCAPSANGARGGLSGDAANAAVKCEKAVAKAGATFAAAKLKRLEKCMDAAFACVQQQPTDPTCIEKARAKCAKQIESLTKLEKGDEDKLQGKIRKDCGPKNPGEPPQVDPADLLGQQGLGHGAPREADRCALFGRANLASIDDVRACLGLQHECRLEQMFAKEAPRAAEMLDLLLGQGTASQQFPCLGTGANGSGQGLPGKNAAKAAVKCQQTIKKAGAKFALGVLKNLQICAAAARDCIQKKPTDTTCLPKAKGKCKKAMAKFTLPPGKGLKDKLAATIVKNCGPDRLAFAEVLDPMGLGYAAEATQCASLGVPSLTSAQDLAECIRIQHQRRTEQLAEKQAPRMRELLEAADISFPLP